MSAIFKSWSSRTHYGHLCKAHREDLQELMELQKGVLTDLEAQLEGLGGILLGFADGRLAVEEVKAAVQSSHWGLLVEELTALLEVIQARVGSLKEHHAEHTAASAQANLQYDRAPSQLAALRPVGPAITPLN